MKTGLAIALALMAFAVRAQTLPKPKEFYFDQDRAAVPIVVVEGVQGDALVDQLVKARERGRKVIEATAQLAHVAISDGRVDLGKQLYDQALASTQAGGTTWRSINWNYGWDLYRLGEYQPALQRWSTLVSGVGAPSWLPPTLAVGLWSVDRKTEAVEWYAAAVRTEPTQWTNPANFAQLLPTWTEAERDTLAEVHQAWVANPPSWP
ncbi:tetratricopeptide repeat protein [Pseudoxanthomonas putridarboris]|uniref:Tetratricopeptide repeat protein n=1 Tax=Pseudoxanthomonas putridarboris TaxID=752605 RepID=A0ABU9IZC5_9GAMM